ncbi:MAG: coproporphyrinogen-III oxidase family protein [Planctomycetota bacterium]
MSTESTKTEVGSYFVSNYPPFSTWKRDEVDMVTEILQSPPIADTPLGLYLHIPFCRKRCKFCYFKVFTDLKPKEIDAYVSALCREIELVSQLPVMGRRPFRFVYFGGGTPSYLSSRQLNSLVSRLRENINWDKAEEVTFECEPGTLQEQKVRTLKDLGVTRLSLGVENFTDEILSENGRAHLSRQVYKAWDWVTKTGFDNVNIDLISGMVGETWENWKFNIAEALRLSPDSVTIYQMELPFNTVYSKDILGNKIETPVADWDIKRAWLNYAYDEFLAAGYKISSAYTLVKNNDKVNFSYRDNLWGGSDLLATGIASFGHVSGVHYQNKADMASYQSELTNEGVLPLGRAYRPSDHQLLIREMILQLKRGFLELDYFQNKFGVDILEQWKLEYESHREDGMLDWSDGRIELTRKGFLHADALLHRFFEPEHQGIRYT